MQHNHYFAGLAAVQAPKTSGKTLSCMLKSKLALALGVLCFSLSLQAQSDECNRLYENGEYKKTIECLSDYIAENPKDVDALSFRAACYSHVGDYNLALYDVSSAIKHHNKKAETSEDALYTQRGKLYEAIESYDEALKDYTAALKSNAKSIDALFARANLYYHLENYTASDADWRQVLKIDKNMVNAQIGLARNMVAQGQVDDAIKELDRLEKIEHENPSIYQYRSGAYAKKGNYRKAIDDVVAWCYLDGIDGSKVYTLCEYSAHEFTYALASVSERVVKAEDSKVSWLYLRTTLYEEREMYKEAVEDYNAIEAISSSPHVEVFEHRGQCYAEMGEYDRAIADFNEGLKLQESTSLYLCKADVERLKGEYKSAIADFTKVIALNPMNSYAYYSRGWTKEFAKNFQGALKDYTTSIEIDKEHAYTYVVRGRLYQLRLNQPRLAEQDFQTALSLEKEIAKDGNCRQYALFHLGNINEAIAHQDIILDKYPTPGNFYDAVCLYSLMNRPADALAYLRIAFEKGYRDFIHMERDTDLDNIRNRREYVELVRTWKNKTNVSTSNANQTVDTKPKQRQRYVVKSKEMKSGIYEIPCTVNDLPLKFIFDTGASDISISSLEAAFMLKNGYLNEYDFRGRNNYQTASGDIVEGTKIRLRKIKIGSLELNNIEASVVDNQNAPLLFGQSALGRLVKVTIDNKNSEIVFER